MKLAKRISLIIVASLILASFAGVFSFADEANLALGATPIYGGYSHVDDVWNWNIANINDGDPLEITHNPENGGGTASGYHSGFGGSMPDPQWVGFDFGAKKTFNTMVVYPVNTYTHPVDFEIQVSNDGETWTTVLSKTDYSIPTYCTPNAHGYLPQTFTFDSQNAQYVRLYATKFGHDGANYAMKLTEIEVFNITEQAPAGPENLALRKPITSDSAHTDTSSNTWGIENLNDGDRVNLCTHYLDYGQYVGYHTSPATPHDGSDAAKAHVTIELGEGTTFNKVVIIPSNELYSIKTLENRNDDPSNPQGLYFPENFRIQVSNDGETWTDVVVKTDYQATVDPQVFEFDAVTGKYVRLQMEKLTHFVKLTEFEVYNVESDTPAPPAVDPVPTGDGMLIGSALLAVVSLAGVMMIASKRKNNH